MRSQNIKRKDDCSEETCNNFNPIIIFHYLNKLKFKLNIRRSIGHYFIGTFIYYRFLFNFLIIKKYKNIYIKNYIKYKL